MNLEYDSNEEAFNDERSSSFDEDAFIEELAKQQVDEQSSDEHSSDDDEHSSTSFDFPILYNDEKKRKWKVWVIDNCIYRTDGLSSKDFTKTPSCREVTAKAHTTAEEQAIIEAKKFWTKKLDDKFIPAEDDEEGQQMYTEIMNAKKKQGGNNHGVGTATSGTKSKGGLKSTKNIINVDVKYPAMLAYDHSVKKNRILWDEDSKKRALKKIETPTKKKYKNLKDDEIHKLVEQRLASEYFDATNGAFVQTKLDGVRCIAFLHKDQVVCYTRNSKQFVHLEKQRNEIKKFLAKHPNVVLDGEWYVHEPVVDGQCLHGNATFNFITSCCKTSRTNPHEHENLIQYHVFDIVDSTKTQTERFKLLQKIFSTYKGNMIIPVQLHVITSEQDIADYQNKFCDEGYEGVILRNPAAYYEGKRVLHLLKYKVFEDSEFIIVGAKAAKGTKKGSVIWICQLPDSDETFTCEMTGGLSLDVTREMYENYPDYLGEPLTVRYQGLSEYNVPRFPKGIAIRNYE